MMMDLVVFVCDKGSHTLCGVLCSMITGDLCLFCDKGLVCVPL